MVFHQTLFNDMGNIHALLLSGKKTGYKIACALAMLVTSERESTVHYQKENLPQEPRFQHPNCSSLLPLTFISVHSPPGVGTGEPPCLPLLPPNFASSPQSSQLF